MGKTFVILGAGLAGIPVAHRVLATIAPKVPGLKVILVSPNTDYFWNPAVVRGVVPGVLSEDKILAPIAPEFAQYPKDSWEIVTGIATSLDPDGNKVTVTEGAAEGAAERVIPYDALLITTGTSIREGMPWKNLDSTEALKDRLGALKGQIAEAKSIVFAGGGFSGIETVGELAFEYGRKKGGWFSWLFGGGSDKNGKDKKDIYFVIDKELPLSGEWLDSVRRAAKAELEKMGVTFITNTKVASVRSAAGDGPDAFFKPGKKTVELAPSKKNDGGGGEGSTTTLEADVYLSALGAVPNTAFVPAQLKDDAGYVRQGKDMRVPGYDNLFVIGDAGNLEGNMAFRIDPQAKHAVKGLEPLLVDGKAEIEDMVIDPNVTGGATLGRSRATGQVGKWKVPSLLIWYIKGRTLGTDTLPELVKGLRTPSGKW